MIKGGTDMKIMQSINYERYGPTHIRQNEGQWNSYVAKLILYFCICKLILV